MELIKISRNAEGQSVVSARELHSFLEVQTRFDTWIERMLEYGFVENQDFNLLKIEQVALEGNRRVKRKIVDYALTLDCAKEISMIQRTERGKQARQYFIDCEKQLREIQKEELITVVALKELEARFEIRMNRLEKQHKQLKRYVNREINSLCELLLPFVDSMQELKKTAVDEVQVEKLLKLWTDKLLDAFDETVFLPIEDVLNKVIFLETILRNFACVKPDEPMELVEFYAMQEGESSLHKLGISAVVDTRKVNLATGNSRPLHKVLTVAFYSRRLAKSFESHIHEFFRRKQERHEWFNLSPEDLAFIEQLGLLYQAYQQRIFTNLEDLPA